MSGNIVSVSWGDHLLFGEGDGRLDSSAAISRRMKRWRDDFSADRLHWRVPRTALPGRYHKAPDYPDTIETRSDVKLDFFKLVPEVAHKFGMRAYLYVSLFDDGYPLAPEEERAISYHNKMHGQHICWQSDFSIRHPEFALVDRKGEKRQWGVLCLAYHQVREHFIRRFRGLLERGDWDGLFLCLRSQSRPADFADQFGFNEPIRKEFKYRYCRDISSQDFDLQLWRALRGEYLTLMLSEVKQLMNEFELSLAVGVPRGGILGPPMDNRPLAWRQWIADGIVDELVINQNSSVCPSMWHDLWPMHRGYGYLQNYLDGHNLVSLIEQVSGEYGPVILRNAQTRLYIARQWDQRSASEERDLLNHPAISGLVFSSFRFDNPKVVERGNWVA
jgi:hypothetical protein